MIIDFGYLSSEQTMTIFRTVLKEMSLTSIIEALESELSSADCAELVAQLDEDDAG